MWWYVFVPFLSLLVASCDGMHVAMQVSASFFDVGMPRLLGAVVDPEEAGDEQELQAHRSFFSWLVDGVSGPWI